MGSSMISSHGVHQTIIFYKEILRFIQQSCMDQKTTLEQKQFWTKTKNGVPLFLIKGVKRPFEDLIQDFRFKQGLLTICNFYRTLKTPVSYDVSTITKVNPKSHTNRYVELIEDIASSFQDFLKVRKVVPFELNSAHNPLFV